METWKWSICVMAAVLATLSGCGTCINIMSDPTIKGIGGGRMSLTDQPKRGYGGGQWDLTMAYALLKGAIESTMEGPFYFYPGGYGVTLGLEALLAVDLPLCAVGDTLTLPVTIPATIKRLINPIPQADTPQQIGTDCNGKDS